MLLVLLFHNLLLNMFRMLVHPTSGGCDLLWIYFMEVGFGYVDWIGLAQDRERWRTLVTAVMYFRVS